MSNFSRRSISNSTPKLDAIKTAELSNNLKFLPVIDSRFTAVNAAGHSTTVLSTFSDINDSSNTNWLMPAAAETLSIVSDSAQDGVAGTGLQQILLQGLDVNFDPIIDVIVLNGITPVLSNIPFRSMHLSIALLGGTPGSGADGTITISSNVDSAIWGRFLPNDTSAETGRLVVPNGERYLIYSTTLSAGLGADMTIKSEVTAPLAFPISLAEIYVSQGVFPIENFIPIFIETGTLFKFRGFTNTGSPQTRKLSATLGLISAKIDAWSSIMN